MIGIVLTVFFPFAAGYYLSYFYRAVPAIIADRLGQELSLTAEALGTIAAAYFLAFAVAQLPLGMALDRFGPRRVQTVLLLIAALGATIFGLGEDATQLWIGRALIGLGCAGGLMGSFKAITLWFPQQRWPLINGCLLGTGGLGALTATTPVEYMLSDNGLGLGWQEIFYMLAIASVIVSILIFVTVPEKEGSKTTESLREQVSGLKQIYGAGVFWRLAPISVFTMAAGMAIHTLWSGPWLRDVALLTDTEVAEYLRVLGISLTAGFVGGGVVADFLTRRGVPLLAVMGGGLILMFCAQAALAFAIDPKAYWPWVMFGLCSNMSALVFPYLSGQYPLHLSGRVSTALNVLVFAFVFVFQAGIGMVIDQYPPTETGFAAEGYGVAYTIILGLEILAFLWLILSIWSVRKNDGSEG